MRLASAARSSAPRPGATRSPIRASREALGRRRDTALALLRAEPWLTRTPEVGIRICLLEDLVAHGPFAPIFHGLREPGREVDWLGREVDRDGRGA